MRHNLITVLVFFTQITQHSIGQTYSFVKVYPGIGIVFNNDSILLGKTNIKETCRILKIKYNDNGILLPSMWDGFDAITFKRISGSEFIRNIKYKSIEFEFASEKDENNLKLRWITIKEDNSFKIYTSNGIEMSELNPKINEIFPLLTNNDHVSEDKLTYNLYSQGISLHLVKLSSGDLKVVEISAHYKLE
jgi:hypothetical protein